MSFSFFARSFPATSVAVALTVLRTFALADFPRPKVEITTSPYRGVRIVARHYDMPRPLRIWFVRIEVRQANVGFDFTRHAENLPGFETASSTTLQFARDTKAEIAINASPFSPIRLLPGQGVQIMGMAANNGEIYSPTEANYDVFAIDSAGTPEILTATEAGIVKERIRDAASGFKIVLRNGKNLVGTASKPTSKPVLHPRTAIGLSADRATMSWYIIDGRQPGKSEGVSLSELAELVKNDGACDALNLDGGGSTTLVVRNPGNREWQVVNTPVGVKNVPGSLRQNGNSIALQIFGTDGDLTAEQLQTIAPTMCAAGVHQFLTPINRALVEAKIDTRKRRAAFVAVLCCQLDGPRILEYTARHIKVCREASQLWKKHRLNELADRGAIREIALQFDPKFLEFKNLESNYHRAIAALPKS